MWQCRAQKGTRFPEIAGLIPRSYAAPVVGRYPAAPDVESRDGKRQCNGKRGACQDRYGIPNAFITWLCPYGGISVARPLFGSPGERGDPPVGVRDAAEWVPAFTGT